MSGFLARVAGASPEILARAPGETVKQETLGGVVLTTSGLAALSMAFALHMALHAPVVVAALLGLLWGAAIANVDRWLLTATTRQDRPWKNIGLALPRFLLAVIIGLVVSTPLTLQVFSPEIDSELTVMQADSQAAFTRQLEQDPRYRELPNERNEILRLERQVAKPLSDAAVFNDPTVADLRHQLEQAQAAYQVAEHAVVCEHEGTCGSNTVGVGPIYREKVLVRDRAAALVKDLSAALASTTAEVRARLQRSLDAERADASRHLSELRATVASTEAAMAAEKARYAATDQSADGLLARLDALTRITTRSATLGWAHAALFLFFTAVECLPVVLKLLFLLARPSLYEQLVTLDEQARLAREQVAASVLVDAEAMRAQAALAGEQASLRQQHETRSRIVQAALDAQQSLATEAIRRWRDEQELVLVVEPDVALAPQPMGAVPERAEASPSVTAPTSPRGRTRATARRLASRLRPRWVATLVSAVSSLGLSRPRG